MSLKRLNILLADDTDDCNFFKDALEELNLSTHLSFVHDGEQLMDLLNESKDLPNVLFLDLNMPRKNGFECLTEIKLNALLKNLPIIIFSTSFEKEAVNLLYKNGAHYFIRKPYEFSQLKKIMQQTLPRIGSENFPQPSREDFVIVV